MSRRRPFPVPRSPFPITTVVAAVMVFSATRGLAQVDPSGSWKTWHTPHFRVHAQAANERIALDAALEAERAYALLSQELTPPRGTIDLTLFDNVDFSNGFTTVFPSSRIAVYLNPPAGDPALGSYDDWLRLVITHELTHAFHLDRTRGIWRVAQRVFGRAPGSFPNGYQPSWVTEGLAVYYETRLTTAGRLRGGLHDQLLASAAAERWPRPGDATLLSPRWPDGYMPYAWGSHFFQWEARARGDSVIPGFVQRTSGQLWPLGVSPAMRGAGGVGLGRAWAALRAQWDSVARAGTQGTVVARGLRTEPRPSLSPDGRRLAYVEATGRRDQRIVVRDVAAGRVVAAHRVNSGVDLVWVGDTVYAGELEFTSPVTVRNALYRWTPGRSWSRVRGSDRLARPFGGSRGRLMAVDLASDSRRLVALEGDRRELVAAPPADAWGYVAASPDGSWLAGARHANGQWDIVAWPGASPADAIALTEDGALDDDPAWSPARDLVLFTSERSGLPQILAYRMKDHALVQLTNEPAGAREPALAPDGTLFYSTLLWDGWAVARATPAALTPAAPRLRPRLARDTITTTSIQVSGYRPWPALQPHFWLPTWHDAGTAGWFAGAWVAGGDPIGRTAYYVQLGVAPSRGRFETLIDVVHQRWKAVNLQATLQQTWDGFNQFDTLQTGDTITIAFGKRQQFGALGVGWRWARWRSLISARLGWEFERTGYVIDRSRIPLTLTKAHFDYGGVVAAASAQRVSFPALAISPENGLGATVLYRRRWETTGPGEWDEWRGVASTYLALPLPGFAHWVLAAHGAAGVRGGSPPDGYDLGGVSGVPYGFFTGYTLGPGRKAFPLRGYPAVGTGFTRAFAGAVELRIPVALVAKALWKLPMGLDRVSVTGFAEAGGGWRSGAAAAPFALRDVGGELVVDLGIPQDVSLRARVGWAVPLVAGLGVASGAGRAYLAFGTVF